MHPIIPNTNPNLTVVRRASDGGIELVPILYWCRGVDGHTPIDLTHMGAHWGGSMSLDFAIHDAATGRVYLRNGDVFDTLAAFAEASQ